MQAALEPFRQARASQNGYQIAYTLSPTAPSHDPGLLYQFYQSTSGHSAEADIRYALNAKKNGIPKQEAAAWVDIFVTYWRAVGKILAAEEAENQGRLTVDHVVAVFDDWKALTETIIDHHASGALPAYNIILLEKTADNLRKFAVRADAAIVKSKENSTLTASLQDDAISFESEQEKLTDVGRVLNRIFSLCATDRSPSNDSRKWGTYSIVTLQFKTYFKLRNINLAKGVIRSLDVQTNMPPLDQFPKPHQVTFKFYTGLLAFVQEDYARAETLLSEAWDGCYRRAQQNQEQILTYLIPCRLVTKHVVPAPALLEPFPRLQQLFGPLIACIKQGDLAGFDRALSASEDEFVKKRIYLTLERGRDTALRNLFRKVFIAGGFEPLKEGQTEADRIRRTRVPIAEFAAALRIGTRGEGSQVVEDDDEVECLLANQIYKGFMKGYISRPHKMVVLNKKGAFPNTGV